VGLQPVLQGEDGLVEVLLGMRQPHQPGELAAAGLQSQQRLGIEPEDGLVLVAVAVGVLDGGLGLANAAEAANSLGQGSAATPGEPLSQDGENLSAAREGGVPPMGDVPNRSAHRRRPVG
jgi:hypothetical protein